MKSNRLKEKAKIEEKLIQEFVDTFKLEQKNIGDTIKDKNGKEYAYQGSNVFDNTGEVEESDLMKYGILEKQIIYDDDKYTYVIDLAPFDPQEDNNE